MDDTKHRLSLDRSVTYQVTVPERLDASWSDWDGQMTVTVGQDADGRTVTILTGVIDQAALQGLLRRLYALGLPLISVAMKDKD